MLDKAKAIQDQLTALRRTIHINPELSFAEFKTAELVATTLSDLGIEYQTGVGKTGVVARLGNGNGPTIGIRADMDALPIEEANDTPYKSQVPGKMHACGHDAHTAMLMGVAMLLHQEKFDGEIRLLFQPSEENKDSEGVSGAPRMIEDGAIEGLDAVIALHVTSQLDAGKIQIRDEFALANGDTVFAKIKGKGGHGAMPHGARDPIFIATPILSAIYGITSRWIKATEPAVITIGRIHAGTASNVIPEQVELDMTVRSLSSDVREQLLVEIEAALAMSRALGGDYEAEIIHGYPALYNDPKVAHWIRTTASDLLDSENVGEGELLMGSEDFGYMSQQSQGAMMWLGTKEPNGPPRFHHHPEFDIDESALPIGAAVLAETALRFVRGVY